MLGWMEEIEYARIYSSKRDRRDQVDHEVLLLARVNVQRRQRGSAAVLCGYVHTVGRFRFFLPRVKSRFRSSQERVPVGSVSNFCQSLAFPSRIRTVLGTAQHTVL
jgi:hypothetical protein